MVKLSNSWVIMNPGGGPTPDKPDISVVNYEFDNKLSAFMNLRVADIQACYEEWRSKGAEFVTPPIDRGAEIRCYMRDPDGYLIEVGQSLGRTGELETEIQGNGWLTVPFSRELLFGLPIENRYDAALASLGITRASLSATAGHG